MNIANVRLYEGISVGGTTALPPQLLRLGEVSLRIAHLDVEGDVACPAILTPTDPPPMPPSAGATGP